MRRLWCRATFRHRGRISHDARGIYWECWNCGHREYVPWEETRIGAHG